MNASQLLGATLLLPLIACGPTGGSTGGSDADLGAGADSGVSPNADGGPTEEAFCEKMDILFVIDDSGSMGEEQANLAENFPLFVDVLNSFKSDGGTPIDYHLGVTTTSVTKSWTTLFIPGGQTGPSGALINNGCAVPGKWLTRDDTNVSDTFSCVAQAVGGANEEMPLEALRLAVSERIADGANTGFFREDALLAIVVLTDEDDCSRTDDNFNLGFGSVCDGVSPVDGYIAAMDDATGERGRWAAAFIAGLGPGSCKSEFGNAAEATRLLDFANKAGDNVVTSSICEGDLSGALQAALETFETACNTFPPID